MSEGKKSFTRKNTVELFFLDSEIKVVGLSFQKCRQTGSVELGSKFDLYAGEKIAMQEKVINVKQPETRIAVWSNDDLLFGKEITEIDGQDDLYASFVIPAGEYLKVSWNAESFDDLVMEDMAKAWERAGTDAFLAEKGLDCNRRPNPDATRLMAEFYPKETINGSDENFPEMYNLYTVNKKQD